MKDIKLIKNLEHNYFANEQVCSNHTFRISTVSIIFLPVVTEYFGVCEQELRLYARPGLS